MGMHNRAWCIQFFANSQENAFQRSICMCQQLHVTLLSLRPLFQTLLIWLPWLLCVVVCCAVAGSLWACGEVRLQLQSAL
jgi:hypothetical protein